MNNRDKDNLKFIGVMYAAFLAPLLVMLFVFHVVGPGHSVEWNNAIFQASLFSVLWTMILFVFSGLVRRE